MLDLILLGCIVTIFVECSKIIFSFLNALKTLKSFQVFWPLIFTFFLILTTENILPLYLFLGQSFIRFTSIPSKEFNEPLGPKIGQVVCL